MSSEEIDEEGYTNAHRAFIQAFMSNPVMSFSEAKPILAAASTAQYPDRPTLEGDITSQLMSTVIQRINTKLVPLDYEIRSTRDQVNQTLTYAFVNTTSDFFTQHATTFTVEELAYIKRVLDQIFETNNNPAKELMALTYREATLLAKVAPPNRSSTAHSQSQLHISRNGDLDSSDAEASQQMTQEPVIKGIDIETSEAVMANLIDQSFFERTRVAGKDYYTLAPRGLLELRSYLKETYNEPADPDDEDDEPIIRIRDCEACREIVTIGLRCGNRDCGTRFHDACAGQYFRNLTGEKECPRCKMPWTGGHYVGVRALEGARRSSGMANGAGRAARGRREVEEEDEEGEGEEEEEMEDE